MDRMLVEAVNRCMKYSVVEEDIKIVHTFLFSSSTRIKTIEISRTFKSSTVYNRPSLTTISN